MIWMWFIVFAACDASDSMYYHEKSARIFSVGNGFDPNLWPNFGFSIASMSSGSKAKLVVGAPGEDNIGKVYSCDLNSNNKNNCISVPIDISRLPDGAKYERHKYWFGAKVKGAETFFVGCAPLIIEKSESYVDAIGTYGRCYLYENTKQKPKPLKTLKRAQREKNAQTLEHTIDSFGWSLDIESKDSIVIGGPAMVSGRVMVTSSKKIISYINGTSSDIKFNFGYDIASGHYFPKSTNRANPFIAVGSPYGRDGHGQVSFLQQKKDRVEPKATVISTVVGSMFGAVLCSAKLTNGNLEDLLVGAPTYAVGEDYNVGAVYVYIASNAPAPTYLRTIVGSMTKSYFGSAIVSLGDLNGDKIEDFAIAAPYENDGRGAVYLYSGAGILNAEHLVPMQKIVPESTMQSFGYSLTAIRDYDDNGCNELAIGAPKINKVMVLRCAAGISIELAMLKSQVTGTNNGMDKTEELPVCFTVDFPDKPSVVKADIVVNVVIQHDGVKLQAPANGNLMFNIYHTGGKETKPYCNNIRIAISGTKGNFNTKVSYVLTASLKDDLFQKENVLPSEVVLNERSKLSKSGAIWVQECGNRICEPVLKLTTTFSEISPYTIGSTEAINETVSVANTGDVAYEACVRVAVTGASVPRPPDVCTALSTTDDATALLECKPNQLLRQGKPWITFISLDTTGITNKNDKIKVETTLYKLCSNMTVADQDLEEFKLIADAESVDVHGRTDEGLSDMVNLTRDDIAAHKTFEHVYTISNNGPTKWVDVKITLQVQKQEFVTTSVYLDDDKCQIETGKVSDSIATYSCLAPKLNNLAGIEVKALMQVTDKLNDIIGKEVLTAQSNITVDLDGTIKSDSVTSQLMLLESTVPIWIIIVASILALVVLIIIFFILRECGLLKRKNKVELKRARTSLRRQTVMRQSMLNRVPSQDKEKLVEEAVSSQSKNKKDRRVVVNAN